MARNKKINLNKDNLAVGFGMGMGVFIMFLLVFKNLPLALVLAAVSGITFGKFN